MLLCAKCYVIYVCRSFFDQLRNGLFPVGISNPVDEITGSPTSNSEQSPLPSPASPSSSISSISSTSLRSPSLRGVSYSPCTSSILYERIVVIGMIYDINYKKTNRGCPSQVERDMLRLNALVKKLRTNTKLTTVSINYKSCDR
jgi:hypothetical protein